MIAVLNNFVMMDFSWNFLVRTPPETLVIPVQGEIELTVDRDLLRGTPDNRKIIPARPMGVCG